MLLIAAEGRWWPEAVAGASLPISDICNLLLFQEEVHAFRPFGRADGLPPLLPAHHKCHKFWFQRIQIRNRRQNMLSRLKHANQSPESALDAHQRLRPQNAKRTTKSELLDKNAKQSAKSVLSNMRNIHQIWLWMVPNWRHSAKFALDAPK